MSPLSLDSDKATLVDLLVDRGYIAEVGFSKTQSTSELPELDMRGRHVWPTLVDLHAHLEKGHTLARTPNVDGSMAGALKATDNDRLYWTEEDIALRMEFGLRCAYVHGVSAIRSHLHSDQGQESMIWSVAKEKRTQWKDRITLQLVSLTPFENYRGKAGIELADLVASSGGILGGVSRPANGVPGALNQVDEDLDRIFTLAAERNLDVDLHVDETSDSRARILRKVAETALRRSFKGRVVCGHCCSLSMQSTEDSERTMRLCAEAGINVVVCPHVNMYLQDRTIGRTPQWRGVAPVQEMRRAGISVSIGGDNCRDGLYAYGDHDMVDTWRQAVRILHLDHPTADSPALAGPVPAETMRLAKVGRIVKGAPASLILFSGRTLNELLCRPQSDRCVLNRGKQVTMALPDYEELDVLIRSPH
jgi:cytosine deaminase